MKLPIYLIVAMLFLGCRAQNAIHTNGLGLPSEVRRLVGASRYSYDSGHRWIVAKVGDTISSGALIQTAENSKLTLLLGETTGSGSYATGKSGVFNPEVYPCNLLGLEQNSALRIAQLTALDPSGPRKTERICLVLSAGTIRGHVRRPSAGFSYQIAFANAVARIDNGIYWLSSQGILRVYQGAVLIETVSTKVTKSISAGKEFNVYSGTITDLPSLPANWMHDFWLPSDPAYEDWGKPPLRKNRK